jgi:hypothetical protein
MYEYLHDIVHQFLIESLKIFNRILNKSFSYLVLIFESFDKQKKTHTYFVSRLT